MISMKFNFHVQVRPKKQHFYSSLGGRKCSKMIILLLIVQEYYVNMSITFISVDLWCGLHYPAFGHI